MPGLKIWEFLLKGGDSFMLRGKRDVTQERLQNMQDMIAKKAYELYEKRNFQNGNDFNDWLEAERLVKRSMRSR